MHSVDQKLLASSFAIVVKVGLIAHLDPDADQQDRIVDGLR